MKHITTIDFGQLYFEKQLEEDLKQSKYEIIENKKIPDSVDNAFQAARSVVLKVAWSTFYMWKKKKIVHALSYTICYLAKKVIFLICFFESIYLNVLSNNVKYLVGTLNANNKWN